MKCDFMCIDLQFISADVFGVFCWSFVDLGDNFEVFDANGEEPKEFFISMVTKVASVCRKMVAKVTSER